ncbi:MAG: ATP-binding protein [Planctomycetia bacterium]|nr:ATP-binding protein [Planctomycetia bacterium]
MDCLDLPVATEEERFRSSNEEKDRFDAVVDRIVSRMEETKWDERDVFAVNLAVVEAINNAIEHGNKCNPSKYFVINYDVTPRHVFVCVRDEGEGFDPDHVPDPRDEDRLDFPSGRGLFLIRHAMDRVSFNTFGNEIYMFKNRSQKSPSGS